MVSSISATTYAGQSSLSLLQSAASSSSNSSLFSAINGQSSSTTATNLFQAICPGSGTSLDSLLSQQNTTSKQNALYYEAAQRVTYMQEGKYDASADWEKVTAYAMQTGQPVTVSINSSTGNLEANTQADSDLSRYNKAQQAKLQSAFADITEMAAKIQANKKNQTMLDNLDGAEGDMVQVHAGTLSAEKDWEIDANNLMTQHKPVRFELDSSGNLTAVDQATEYRSDLNAYQNQLLQSAAQRCQEAITSGDLSETWMSQAAAYDEAGVPFYLDIDSSTNEIVAKESSGENLTPDFLKDDPYPDIGANTKLLKQVADYIDSGTAYFLDIDTTGQVVAKELTGQNLIKYNSSTTSSSTSTNTLGSVLSIIA